MFGLFPVWGYHKQCFCGHYAVNGSKLIQSFWKTLWHCLVELKLKKKKIDLEILLLGAYLRRTSACERQDTRCSGYSEPRCLWRPSQRQPKYLSGVDYGAFIVSVVTDQLISVLSSFSTAFSFAYTQVAFGSMYSSKMSCLGVKKVNCGNNGKNKRGWGQFANWILPSQGMQVLHSVRPHISVPFTNVLMIKLLEFAR